MLYDNVSDIDKTNKGEIMKRVLTVIIMLMVISIGVKGKGIYDKIKVKENKDSDIKGISTRSITFQGYITDSTGVELQGAVVLSCTLWTDSTGGASVWGDDSIKVTAEEGVITKVLSLPYEAFANNKTLYMGVSINGEFLGRLQMTSSPWSYISERSDTSLMSLNAQSIGGNKVSETGPIVGYVLRWNGSEWSPSADTTGGYLPESFLNNVNDTFGILEGDSLRINRKLFAGDIILGDSILWINKIVTDPQVRFKASNYIFYDKQYPDRTVNIYDGYIKQTGGLYTKCIVDSGDLLVSGGNVKIENSNIGVTTDGLLYTKGIVDSGDLSVSGYTELGKYLYINTEWSNNPDTSNHELYNRAGITLFHGNSYIYDDVTLVGDTLTNNQAFLGLSDVTDSSMMQIRPYSLRSFKSFTSPSRDTDSTYWALNNDGYILTNYADEGLNDTTVQINDGYVFAKDSIKLNTGEAVTKFIKVGSHAGIIFNDADTFWLAKDTMEF